MGTEISYDGVVSVSDFIKENIQNKGGFGDDGVIFINLDASWDKLDWDELKQFVKHCEANGQMAGAYWSPFCDYAGVEDRAVEGNNGYVYGQALLKVSVRLSGKPVQRVWIRQPRLHFPVSTFL